MLNELTENQLVLVSQWKEEIKSSYQEIIDRSLSTYKKFKNEDQATFFKNAMITGKTGTIGSENYLVRILYTNQGDLSDALPEFNKYLLKGKNINYIL